MPIPPNATAVENLQPQRVWQFFAQMSAVPRPSKREEKIRAHMRQTAEQHGWTVREDPVGNLLIEVPATPGCESAPPLVLQGHLDMVCEKNSGTQFDFDNDPIKLIHDKDPDTGDEIIRADGTTLGADNGIGVALALAAATDPDVQHGPLEILCTADEEMGMTGAKALDPNFFKGRRMLNLDSEEDDAIYIGCAGGRDSTLTWNLPLSKPPAGAEACKITVSGLRGGHSGGDIHENRGNAIKLLVQVLRGAEDTQRQLVELTGGSKRNAIPREASATVIGEAGTGDALKMAAEMVQGEVVKHAGEPNCFIKVETAQAADAASTTDTHRILTALAALPHGVLAVVPTMPDLVQTSNSTSTVTCDRAGDALNIVVGCLSRSSHRPELHATARQIAAVGELAGAKVESGNEYPGWAPNPDSPMLATCRRVYQNLFNEEPNVTAIHAGLECGLIGERMGEGQMDMVSFGPTIRGAHSPDERVYVKSVDKAYTFVKKALTELAKA